MDTKMRLPFYNDDVFKAIIDLSTTGSYFFVQRLIYDLTGIFPFSIIRLDRVFNDFISYSKSSISDGMFLVNNEFIIDIEVQRYLSIKALSNKIHRYLGYMLTTKFQKGDLDISQSYQVIMIVIYDGSVNNDDELIATAKYKGDERNTRIESNMNTYVVQLTKTKRILKRKRIEGMNKLEKMSFVVQNAHNPKYSDTIKLMEQQEREVRYMETRYKDFTMNPAAFLMAKRKEVNEESQRIMMREYREEGLKEGLEKGLKDGLSEGLLKGRIEGKVEGQINTLTRQLERIYHQDLQQWLEGLAEEQLDLVEELILERLDYQEFMIKVEGVND